MSYSKIFIYCSQQYFIESKCAKIGINSIDKLRAYFIYKQICVHKENKQIYLFINTYACVYVFSLKGILLLSRY